MIDQKYKRAMFFYEQGRWKEAEKEFRALAAEYPDAPLIFCKLAICCYHNEKIDEALEIAKSTIKLDPEYDYSYYINSFLNYRIDNNEIAHKHIDEAISLAVENANYHGHKAAIFLSDSKWKEAEETANTGLSYDPENLSCLNLRTMALTKLNKKVESVESILETLQRDPHDSYTHTNAGWSYLENGQTEKALEHFKIALSIDAGSNYAREGMIEAMKGKYFLYRLWLNYKFRIERLEPRTRIMLFIGLIIFIRVVGSLGKEWKAFEDIAMIVLMIYMLFVFSTWIMDPLSNLFFRLNKFGRMTLSKQQILQSNFIAVSFFVALSALTLWIFTSHMWFLFLLIYALTMMIPLSSWHRIKAGKSGKGVRIYIVALGIVGLLALFRIGDGKGDLSVFSALYIVGLTIFTWVVGVVINR